MTSVRHKWLSTRNVVGGGLGIAVIVGTFVFVLPRIADYRDVWGVVKTLTWRTSRSSQQRRCSTSRRTRRPGWRRCPGSTFGRHSS